MTSIVRHATVPYSAAQMFALVSDVEAYPDFLGWCSAARVRSRDELGIEAELTVGVPGIEKRFTTRNELHAPHRITMNLVNGPFRYLRGEWLFAEGRAGTEVSLKMDFEIVRSPLGSLFAKIFEQIARSQMNAFLVRAEKLYG